MIMNRVYIILLMIFCHIVDDYYLQGWLASAKQKEWWIKNNPSPLYQYDYIWALIMHSFSWTFMVMLPLWILSDTIINTLFIVCFFLNIAIHAIVDDLKANKGKINLWEDQIIHIVQIVSTALAVL